MKPRIERAGIGLITIAGVEFDHDVIIQLRGAVKARNSPLVNGASHLVDLAEARDIYERARAG
jgi:hypothetical protein